MTGLGGVTDRNTEAQAGSDVNGAPHGALAFRAGDRAADTSWPTRINVHDTIRTLYMYTVRRFSMCHHCGYVHLGHYQPTRRPSRLAVSSRHVPNGTYPGLVRDIFPSQIRTIISRWREIHDQDETPAPSGNARLGDTPGDTHFWFRIATWTYICFALGSRCLPNRGFKSQGFRKERP